MNFIGEYNIENDNLCVDIIKLFNNHPHKTHGYAGNKIDFNIKKSTDLSISPNNFYQYDSIQKYIKLLQLICEKYINKYKWCNQYSPWTIVESINIQYYKPSEAFYAYHTERFSSDNQISNRHLVFMTYLNDVSDGGETEFYYQKVKFKPKTGKTLIWPTDWTHTHRGLPSLSEEKYIITGWYSYYAGN